MNPVNREGSGLVDQDRALDSYFEALLYEHLSSDDADAFHDAVRTAAHGDAAAPVAQEALSTGRTYRDEQPLDAIIFTVDGLRLALPAVKLARVVDFPHEILPGDTPQPWYVGRCVIDQQDIDIIDPAEIAIPPSHRVRSSDDRRHDMRHLLLIDGTPWAVACQEVETVTLDTGQIHWRTVHTQRRWLAGTAMSHACGLLDVEGLLSQLAPTPL